MSAGPTHRRGPQRAPVAAALAAVVALVGLVPAVHSTAFSATRQRPPGVTAPPGGRPAGPTPHIQPFAQLPGVRAKPRLGGPPVNAERLTTIDGCDRSYGSPPVCVPRSFPPGVTDRCTWLRGRGYQSLTRRGPDRHQLDRNADGKACGPGD
jgi:hypothetical protein